MRAIGFFGVAAILIAGTVYAAEGGWQRYMFTAIGLIAAGVITYLLKKNAGQRLFCWSFYLSEEF